MRRLAAALLATTLLLTACGGDSDEPETETPTEQENPGLAEPSADDVAALEAVQVDGDPGSEPTLTFDQPFDVTAPVGRVESEGSGDDLVDGQVARIHYVAVSGDDGTVLGSTWANDTPDRITVGDPNILPALTDALAGQKVGARVLFAAPSVPSTQEDVPDTPATIMAIDVLDARTIPDSAEGTAVEPPAGLPVVTFGDDGVPTIDVEGVEAPTELVVQPLIEGDGPAVEAGQTITAHYHGVLLENGETFDSSWERGEPAAFPIGVGGVIAGWDEGITGVNVGSRVLLVIPAEKGYADQERPGIPPGSDLVFVVDVLDAG